MRRLSTLATASLLLFVGPTEAAPTGGFLDDHDLNAVSWLPPSPVADGPAETADIATYLGTRSLVSGTRGAEAHADDVCAPADVAPRFGQALGVTLTPANAQVIIDTIHVAQLDLESLVKPVKRRVAAGGRVRPYVQFPDLPACQHDIDDRQFGLNKSRSYPSTHAAVGMLWALILSQLAPDRSDALFVKGYEFGERRLVCGFHYSSDLAGGRLAANVLFARLQSNKAFVDQMAAAKAQLDTLRGVGTPATKHLVDEANKRESSKVLAPLDGLH